MASKYAIIVAALLAGTSPVLAQGGGGGGGEAVLAERAAEQVAGLLEARRLAVARDRHRCQRQQVPQMGTLEPPVVQLTQPPSIRNRSRLPRATLRLKIPLVKVSIRPLAITIRTLQP